MLQVASALPREVWFDVFRSLDPPDLFNLRLSCKKFNEIVSLSAVWKPRCYSRWLDHLSHDVFTEEIVSDNQNWFYYFRYRNRIDQSVLKLLHRITQEKNNTEYWHLYKLVLRHNPSRIIPLISNIVNDGFLAGSMPFDVVTLCRHLLTSLRHKHVYDLFGAVGETSQTFVHGAEETFFLPLAAMDPSFDRLLHFRCDTHDRIHALIEKEFSGVNEFLSLPATLRVDKLTSYLFGTLDLLNKKRQLYLEDFMLLRIYAQETAGHPLLILSMIQSLATKYAVETILCGSYLIIHDSLVRDRETYLTIASNGVPKIFTRKRLVQSFKRILGSSDYVIQSEILPTILQPLKFRELLTTVFKNIIPLHNKSKWSVAAPRTVGELKRLFPKSAQPVKSETINYFLCVFKAMEFNLNTGGSISVLFTVTYKEVFRLVAKLYPGDLPYAEQLLKCRGADFCEIDHEYKDWLSQVHNITLKNCPELGRFVTSLRDEQVMCIVGIKEHHNGEMFYTLMNFAGEFYVENSINVQILNSGDEETVIKRFLAVASQSDLGLAFSGIDWGSRKLIPNIQVQYILQKDSCN